MCSWLIKRGAGDKVVLTIDLVHANTPSDVFLDMSTDFGLVGGFPDEDLESSGGTFGLGIARVDMTAFGVKVEIKDPPFVSGAGWAWESIQVS